MSNDPTIQGESRTQRLQRQFDTLIELPAAQQQAWLQAHVADEADRTMLLRLLAADHAGGFLDTPAVQYAQRLAPEDIARPEGLIGQQVGEFRIERELGQGGMAAVFLGKRTGRDFEQLAAVKLLRRGLYSELEQRLFLRERRLLAGLDHPNIARLIDGGVTDAGIPYLVIEYVDGTPITDYANAQRLDLRQRLELFLIVCRAVSAAHRNLIIHRDIKPSNILVSRDGMVKLLDFGIAKLIEDDGNTPTATVGVFTPDYAAPEQLAGSAVTTATDVYGLGVLLHELLVGVRPDGMTPRRPSSLVDTHRGKAGSDNHPINFPADPARLRKLLRGDLDNILLKALAAEPAQRYATASALADDIERYLRRQPVAAHPPSRLYRTGKFVQRHRHGVAFTCILLLALLAMLGVALWQADVARHEAARANTVRDFVVGLFDAARAHLPRNQRPTPEMLVAQARRRLSTRNDLDASTRADLSRTLGQVELSLSNFESARKLFVEAEKLSTVDGDRTAAREARVFQAESLQRSGKYQVAMRMDLALLGQLRASPSPTLLQALSTLAAAEMATGHAGAAIAHLREASNDARRIYGPDSVDALAAGLEVGNALAEAQRYPEAIKTLTPLLARWRSEHGPQDDRFVTAMESLATATDGVGDLPATQARFRELLALKRRIYTAPNDSIAATLRDLGVISARAEKYGKSEKLLNEALQMQQAVFGPVHPEIAATYNSLGATLVMQRRYADADADYRAAIAICDKGQIKEEVCARARNNLGMSLYRQGWFDDARVQMTEALAERRALFGNDHPTVAYSLSTLANVAVKQKQPKQAVQLSAQALAVLKRAGRGGSREDALIRNTYAQALWLAGRNDDALREINRSIADWQRLDPDAKGRSIEMLSLKAEILIALKREGDARKAVEGAVKLGAKPADLAPDVRVLVQNSGAH